jgi:putative transposase
VVDLLVSEHGLSERRSCAAVRLSRSVYYYQPDTTRDDPVIEALLSAVERYPRYGFRKLFLILRREGHDWNHKRVYRVYCQLKLNLRRRGKRRLPGRHPQPLSVPALLNESWSADFMSDALMCGRRFRTFNVVDDCNREVLAIEIDLNLPAQRVVRSLERIAAWRGYPSQLRVDNGPEFVSLALAEWAEQHDVKLEFIQPGKPTQNSFVERFNRTYRTEVLDFYVFRRLSEVREITDKWIREYNEERPHESLGDLTPIEYRSMQTQPETSRNGWH